MVRDCGSLVWDEDPSSLGEDQLVLAGETQPIGVATMMDDHLAGSDKEVAAVDLVLGD